MAEFNPTAHDAAAAPKPKSELRLRVVSAVVLAPLAIITAYWGGWGFVVFWTVAAVAVFWEWSGLVLPRARRQILPIGTVAITTASVFAALQHAPLALAALILGAFLVTMLADLGQRGWSGSGVLYAGMIMLAPVVLRASSEFGFLAVLLLFAVVWSTDIGAYFAGRSIGGPKLWPAVSPKKTWSGALAGTAAGIVAGSAVTMAGGFGASFALGVVILLLSIASQAGDLFESAVKRRFGAKDASHLIPGHGGLMDRLDGFVIAASVAAAIGVARAGLAAPSRGLLVW